MQGPQKRKFCLAGFPDASCLGPGLPPSCYACLHFHGLAPSLQLRMLALPPKSGTGHAVFPSYFIRDQLYEAKYACHRLSDACHDLAPHQQSQQQSSHIFCCAIYRPASDIEYVHKVNVIGPLLVSQAMLPLIKKGHKKVVRTPSCHRFWMLTWLASILCLIVRQPLQSSWLPPHRQIFLAHIIYVLYTCHAYSLQCDLRCSDQCCIAHPVKGSAVTAVKMSRGCSCSLLVLAVKMSRGCSCSLNSAASRTEDG